jgi:hypothetical protein
MCDEPTAPIHPKHQHPHLSPPKARQCNPTGPPAQQCRSLHLGTCPWSTVPLSGSWDACNSQVVSHMIITLIGCITWPNNAPQHTHNLPTGCQSCSTAGGWAGGQPSHHCGGSRPGVMASNIQPPCPSQSVCSNTRSISKHTHRATTEPTCFYTTVYGPPSKYAPSPVLSNEAEAGTPTQGEGDVSRGVSSNHPIMLPVSR